MKSSPAHSQATFGERARGQVGGVPPPCLWGAGEQASPTPDPSLARWERGAERSGAG